MVFDWFRRRTAPQAETAAETPAEQAPGTGSDSDLEVVAPEAEIEVVAAVAAVVSEVAEASVAPPDSPAEAASTPPAPAAATAGAVDQEALAWARQAYARLKAQQQAASPAAATVVSAPPSPAVSPSSPAEVAPNEPAAPTPVSLDGPAPAAPGRSLLEQAAAQRQQRLQELTAQESLAASEALAAPADRPAAAGTGTSVPGTAVAVPAGDDPQLGDFDDTFTWSAEVLAAQGRTVDQVSIEEIDWLGRLRRGLEKTRRGFVTQLLDSLGDDPLTPEVIDDLETTLLRADVGVQATDQVLAALRQRLNEEVVDPAEGLRFLKEQLRGLLEAPISASGRELLVPERGRLNVWLLVGVNGVGKTTTLGKLANLAVRSGYSCLIAAADTFRAAAVQQVSVWGERSGVAVISNPSANADPAAVVYDAIGAAQAKGSELVLVDTAGRLQTKHNLMEELAKVRRIIDKLAPEAAVESLLVLDASQGQNGLKQAMAFAQAAGLTGVVLTKLDGSARGGVALAVASEAKLPIRFIGAGETIRDLRPFNSFEFVEALLAS